MAAMTESSALNAVDPQCDPQGTGTRVLREIIRTPAFREILKLHVDSIDPASAGEMVRTLIQEDPNLSLSLMAASPRMVNYMVEALLEVGRQAGGFPPELMDEFVQQVSQEIDTNAMLRLPEVYKPLLERVSAANPEMREKVADGMFAAINGFIRAYVSILRNMQDGAGDSAKSRTIDGEALGEAFSLSTRALNRSIARNPGFLRDLMANLDFRAMAGFTFSIAWACLLALISIPGRMVRSILRSQEKSKGNE